MVDGVCFVLPMLLYFAEMRKCAYQMIIQTMKMEVRDIERKMADCKIKCCDGGLMSSVLCIVNAYQARL